MGLRYDYYLVRDLEDTNGSSGELRNSVLVPRVNLLYKITPDMRIRAGYAQGYRAPQVFNEDLHIELVNATRVQTINSEDLKQESSHAFSVSFNTDFSIAGAPSYFLAEGFYTLLVDPFSDEFYDPDNDGNFVYLRVNADDGAYVTGTNLEFKSFITRTLETQVGYTVQKSAYESPQAWGEEESSISRDFMRTPNQYGYATFNWNPLEHFSTNLSFSYTGSMWVPHFKPSGETLERTQNFLTTDLLFSYGFDLAKKHQTELRIYAGIVNIFNQYQDDFDIGIYRDAGYVYGPRQPRTINIGLKLIKL
jgi:outer membrane receptor for ferrienterochelin and colicins